MQIFLNTNITENKNYESKGLLTFTLKFVLWNMKMAYTWVKAIGELRIFPQLVLVLKF